MFIRNISQNDLYIISRPKILIVLPESLCIFPLRVIFCTPFSGRWLPIGKVSISNPEWRLGTIRIFPRLSRLCHSSNLNKSWGHAVKRCNEWTQTTDYPNQPLTNSGSISRNYKTLCYSQSWPIQRPIAHLSVLFQYSSLRCLCWQQSHILLITSTSFVISISVIKERSGRSGSTVSRLQAGLIPVSGKEIYSAECPDWNWSPSSVLRVFEVLRLGVK
jgi:hypothetical protein